MSGRTVNRIKRRDTAHHERHQKQQQQQQQQQHSADNVQFNITPFCNTTFRNISLPGHKTTPATSEDNVPVGYVAPVVPNGLANHVSKYPSGKSHNNQQMSIRRGFESISASFDLRGSLYSSFSNTVVSRSTQPQHFSCSSAHARNKKKVLVPTFKPTVLTRPLNQVTTNKQTGII